MPNPQDMQFVGAITKAGEFIEARFYTNHQGRPGYEFWQHGNSWFIDAANINYWMDNSANDPVLLNRMEQVTRLLDELDEFGNYDEDGGTLSVADFEDVRGM